MVRVIHNRDDYETGNRFGDEVQTVELWLGGVALISAGQPEGFTPLLLSSLLSSYIDTDPYSFCLSLNVLLVKYFYCICPS